MCRQYRFGTRSGHHLICRGLSRWVQGFIRTGRERLVTRADVPRLIDVAETALAEAGLAGELIAIRETPTELA